MTAHADFVTLVYPTTAEKPMSHTEDRITDLDILIARQREASHRIIHGLRKTTIADAMPPADGVWDLRRIQAVADKNAWLTEEVYAEIEDDDGFEHDVTVIVLLGGYIPAQRDSWDEPGHAEYFEDTMVFVQCTPVMDEERSAVSEPGDERWKAPREERYRELADTRENQAQREDYVETATIAALDGMR